MKKIFVILFGILLSSVIYAQEKNALVIKLIDGNTHTFILSEKPVVTLPDGNIAVNGSASTTYPRSEVEKFYFVYDDGSGIESISKDNITFYYVDGENVRISGLKDMTTVSVTSLDGKIISTQKCDGTGSVTISLGNQPKGIYIISFEGRSVKIKK